MEWLGLDIGGANLKLGDCRRLAVRRNFALWRDLAKLPDELRSLLAEAPAAPRLAITMTGELADCFRTKAEGVDGILAALEQAAPDRELWVYGVDGEFHTPQAARARPLLVAASNWHALAYMAGRMAPRGPGLLIDIGGTTTDIVPLDEGAPVALGATDPDRLRSAELVYTGVERTPLCAVTRTLPWRGHDVPVAAEWFATMLDAYLLLGNMAEDAERCDTADNRPALRAFAHDRLARCLCADRDMLDEGEAVRLAEVAAEAQLAQLAAAARRVLSRMRCPPETIVVSGSGEFLARRLIERLRLTAPVASMNQKYGPLVSACAPARAVAKRAAAHFTASPGGRS